MIQTSLKQIADSSAEARQQIIHEEDIYSPAAWNRFFADLNQTATVDALSEDTPELIEDPPAALAAGTDYLQNHLDFTVTEVA